MFEALIGKYKQRKATKEWSKSPLGQSLTLHTQEYFYGKIASLSGKSQGAKDEIIADFCEKVFSIDQADNPFLKLRELLATYVVALTRLQVLCLTEEEKAGQFYADCPYISGELHHHIRALSDHNEELKRLKWSHGNLTDAELVGVCNIRSAVLLYYVNGLNIVRMIKGDRDKPKDWFCPFLRSMLIWDEDTCRRQIELPSLLPRSLEALEHSTFMNMVVDGYQNPLYEWEKAYQR